MATKENRDLRGLLMSIENMIVKALSNQPHEDEDCRLHLIKTLGKVADMSADYSGIVEVKVDNIVWDTDGEKVKNLPKSVRMVVHQSDDIDDDIVDALSNEWQWCVKSCNWRIV